MDMDLILERIGVEEGVIRRFRQEKITPDIISLIQLQVLADRIPVLPLWDHSQSDSAGLGPKKTAVTQL
ncbi:hypothetical protein DPMN_174246 [Dreissena polymorpha]|uniref:Uncharacterized protein n=1 Tax=Dreissena polymorpha TaxID=45954 RepID=A0A9D4E328_DREPO|nr:hypothetical protein DPMN_174246 [Dreissena polymorpha]